MKVQIQNGADHHCSGKSPGAHSPRTDKQGSQFDIDSGAGAGAPGGKSHQCRAQQAKPASGNGPGGGSDDSGTAGQLPMDLNQLIQMFLQWLTGKRTGGNSANGPVGGATPYAPQSAGSGGAGGQAPGTAPYSGTNAYQNTSSTSSSVGATGSSGQSPTGAPGLYMDPNHASHTLSSSAPPAIQQHKTAIEAASRETGVPANRIAATMWAESRGNLHQKSTPNPDNVNTDLGLMQINTETYSDVQKAQGSPNLDLNNPIDNIRAGAWELRDKFMNNGNDWVSAHAAYRGVKDGEDLSYAYAVDGFALSIERGGTLADSGRW